MKYNTENIISYNDMKLEDIIMDASSFIKLNIPEKKTYLHPWIKESELIMICGWRGTGKTMFALSILDAISRGGSFGPWSSHEPTPCLYLDGEMAAIDTINRIKSLSTSEPNKNFYIYSDAYATQEGKRRATLLNEDWREKIKTYLIEHGIKVWIIDNASALSPGIDENSKEEWDVINNWFLDLRFSGITTIFLHHEGKGGKQRGTSGREDFLDISLRLQRPSNYNKDKDGCRFIASFEKDRIPDKDRPLIQNVEFKLIQNDNKPIWEYGDAKSNTQNEVLKLFHEGLTNKEITEKLKISKSRVSQIKKSLIEDGLLTNNNKLTKLGAQKIFGD